MSGPTSNCSLVETEARGGEVTCPNLHGVEWQNWDWNWLQSCSLSPRSARLGLEEALDTPVADRKAQAWRRAEIHPKSYSMFVSSRN